MLRSVNRWTLNIVVIVFLFATPLFTLLINLFGPSSETWQHLSQTVLSEYVSNSFWLLLGVGGLSLLFGVPAAWLVSTCEFPGRKYFEWMLILPLAIPSYILAYTYVGILDYTGFLQVFLRNSLGWEVSQEWFDIMNLKGAIFVMALALYPYVYVSARAAFLKQSQTLLESSRNLGSSSWESFFKVVLPVSRPAIFGGLFLVLMEVLNDYGAVTYYGINTFTTGIFRAWFSLGDLNAAIRMAILLLFAVFLIITLERYQRGKARFHSKGVAPPFQSYKLSGLQKVFSMVVCILPLLFGFIIPVSQLIYWVYLTAAHVVNNTFFILLGNSFLLAVTASFLCIGVSVILAYSLRLNQPNWVKYLSRIAVMGYSIPGAVIAVGVMVPVLFLDKQLGNWLEDLFGINAGFLLNGTFLVLVFAYLVRFLAVSYNPIESGFTKTCGSLDEASRSLGVSPSLTLWKINLPLIKEALLGAAILVFVDVLKELPLTLILRPFNFNTLATSAYILAGDEQVAESANAALVIILIGILPIILLNRLISKQKSNGNIAA
ncbi:ABC transporter permease [Xanthovirga aplysinae]|uniref:ABC transporter permease n=1 Tax=Xanthovirga aplysinae TaxID=2529853 RepID=UPI0012BD2E11|nr:iron ABC transporter permease [Xanthovirga aplysinae]